MAELAVAIAGCGTAGLASALFLRAAGAKVTLFEQFAAPKPLGAGVLLQPAGLAVLGELGLLRGALERGARIGHILGTTVTGRKVLDIGYRRLSPDLHGLGIHRGTLFELLHGEVLRQAIAIRTASRIVATPRDGAGRILQCADGTAHGPFDLVVDASGVQSVIRGLETKVRLDRVYPYGAVWGVVEIAAGDPNGATLWQRYNGTSTMLGLLPIGRKPGDDRLLAALFWSVRRDQQADLQAAGLAAWQRQVLAVAPETAAFIGQFSSLDQLTVANYSDVVLRRPFEPGLAIIGDAAHATSPQLGQGANHALLDARALGLAIATVVQGETSVDEALDAYFRQRRGQIAFYQRASRWLTPVFQSDSRVIGALRDWTLGPLCHLPWLRTEMALTLAGMKTGLFSAMRPQAPPANLSGSAAIQIARSVDREAR